MAPQGTNPTSIHEDASSSPGLSALRIQLWCRTAAATLIRSLAWELPCAASVALKSKKKKKKEREREKENGLISGLTASAYMKWGSFKRC